MNLPSKLPRVVGDSYEARALAMVFERVNQLIDYCESILPRETNSTRITRTKTGTTIEADTSTVTTSTTSDEARWA